VNTITEALEQAGKTYRDFSTPEEFIDFMHRKGLVLEDSTEKAEQKKMDKEIEAITKKEAKEKKDDSEKKKKDDKDAVEGKDEQEKKDVVYADLDKIDNIFKHIVIFTNDRDPKNNLTLKNLIDAVDTIKKAGKTVPEIHIFVAASVDCDDTETEIKISDEKGEFTIKEESNLDTLIFSRLGVQGEDNCEHVVELLQDRGFLVLNPTKYSALACNKYETACLLKKGNIPQPNFCLMNKEILEDKKLYLEAMRDVEKDFSEDSDKNEDFKFVVKILDGHGGTGVFMSDGKKLLAILQAIFAIDPERQLIIQRKEEGDGGDIRVHVLTLRDRQVILGAMKRVQLTGDFRSNKSLGADTEPVKLTPEQEQIALRTAELSKMPWCAVDIMPLVKGSNKELGDNVVLEINASPGTDGITSVLKHNFINILLSELTDPSEFFIQRKQAGWLEAIEIWFDENTHKEYLAKLDTGNGTSASTVEVGKLEEKDGSVSFDVDGKRISAKVVKSSKALVGDAEFERKVIIAPLVRIGLRQMSNVPISVIEKRDKSTNVLVNRDLLSKLGYVVVSDETHILTPEIEKVNIV
jgi:glutathione synthase/RimK-type ligase-like ATP-grasp enzyme